MTLQHTPEWYAERREGVTSTDMTAILGLSPYRSEADVAREKQGEEPVEPDTRSRRRFAIALAIEDVIKAEDEIEHGLEIRRVPDLKRHPTIPWALTSLDFERVAERTIVETKSTHAARWSDGLPLDVEAQVRWQMGVADYPRAHVVALRYGSQLQCFDVEHDEQTWLGLVAIAEDFRRRLAAGGPFAESLASVNRHWRTDTGAEMIADEELAQAVHELLTVESEMKRLQRYADEIETRVKDKMADAASLAGSDFRVSWKRSRDGTTVGWEQVASAYRTLLQQLRYARDEGKSLEVGSLLSTDLDVIEGLYTTTRPGARPFRIYRKGDSE